LECITGDYGGTSVVVVAAAAAVVVVVVVVAAVAEVCLEFNVHYQKTTTMPSDEYHTN
jgi:hypothetical protein